MRKSLRLHILLFVLTFLTMLVAGVIQENMKFLDDPMLLFPAFSKDPLLILKGFPFALTLSVILLGHEMGHYFASRAHHTHATLPYFIPAPSIIGTFGAFIKMTSPIKDRKALVDIGASGPLIGFVLSVIACIAGLWLSKYGSIESAGEMPQFVVGTNLLFSTLSRIIVGLPPSQDMVIELHPMAFAGWVGLFVTSLNLIPVGQLDGGHVLFALLGNAHRRVSVVLVFLLALLGFVFWLGWAFWAFLLMVLGVNHPPVLYWERPLDMKRKLVSLSALVIFVVTFIPTPFGFIVH